VSALGVAVMVSLDLVSRGADRQVLSRFGCHVTLSRGGVCLAEESLGQSGLGSHVAPWCPVSSRDRAR